MRILSQPPAKVLLVRQTKIRKPSREPMTQPNFPSASIYLIIYFSQVQPLFWFVSFIKIMILFLRDVLIIL